MHKLKLVNQLFLLACRVKTTNALEVDCIVEKDGRVELLLQVCQEMSDSKTRNREIRALLKAVTEIPHACDARLMILSYGPGETVRQDGLEIEVVDVIDWLLGLEE